MSIKASSHVELSGWGQYTPVNSDAGLVHDQATLPATLNTSLPDQLPQTSEEVTNAYPTLPNRTVIVMQPVETVHHGKLEDRPVKWIQVDLKGRHIDADKLKPIAFGNSFLGNLATDVTILLALEAVFIAIALPLILGAPLSTVGLILFVALYMAPLETACLVGAWKLRKYIRNVNDCSETLRDSEKLKQFEQFIDQAVRKLPEPAQYILKNLQKTPLSIQALLQLHPLFKQSQKIQCAFNSRLSDLNFMKDKKFVHNYEYDIYVKRLNRKFKEDQRILENDLGKVFAKIAS